MRYDNIEQGSAEWLALRCGKVTASRVKDVMGTKAKRDGYLWELVTERLAGQASDHYVTEAMRWGQEVEPVARNEFEIAHDVTVERPAFFTHDKIPYFGASPDGIYLMEYGLFGLEIKCPFNTSNHLKWMKDGVIPKDHMEQVLTNMACSNADGWSFMSFDPRLPDDLKEFSLTVLVEDVHEKILEVEQEVIKFIAEVDEMTNWYTKRR